MDSYSKLVFKPPSRKVAAGRNSHSDCTLPSCSEREKPGRDKFPVCAGCKHKRYCFSLQTRVHQVQDWPRHKKECKEYQKTDKTLGILATENKLTDAQIIFNLLEDFACLHECTFQKIVNYAYHSQIADSGIDMSRGYARANLEYRADSKHNPARAFRFITLEIIESSPGKVTPEALQYREHFNTNRQNDRSYIDCIRCVFTIVSDVIEAQKEVWCPLHHESIPERLTYEWYDKLLRCVDRGIVLRKIESAKDKKMVWAAGVMIQDGSRWVWNERTEEQIRAAKMLIPSIETWAGPKFTSVIYYPNLNKVPYVAPEGFIWEQ